MCSRNIKKHLPVAEVGGGRSRRSEVGGQRRRSVAEVGGGVEGR